MRKTKKFLATVLSAVMLLSMLAITPTMAAEETTGMILYVSTTGNDQADGTEAAPLATLQGARDKIRSIKSTSGLPKGGITVVFREGQYKWTDTVKFDSQDSGTADSKIVYRSYPGEKVYFEGGVKIPGSQFTPVTDEEMLLKWPNNKVKQTIRQLDIGSIMKKAGYTDVDDYYPFTKSRYNQGLKYANLPDGEKEPDENPNSLIRRPMYSFEGEQAMWAARYPNKSGGPYADVNPYTQTMPIDEVVKNGGTTEISIMKYSDRRISKYSGRDDVFLGGCSYSAFYHTEQEIEIDSSAGTITSKTPMDRGMRQGRPFFIFNILEELDAPGEYFIDKNTGIMYIYPTSDVTNKTLNVALFDKDWMIETNAASHITFSGITFENTKGGAAFVDKGDSVRFEYCDFINLGTFGVSIGEIDGVYTNFAWGPIKWTDIGTMFEPFTAETTGSDKWATWQTLYWQQDKYSIDNTGKNHSIYGCHMMNIGAAAIDMEQGNLHRDEDANIVIENNIIEFNAVYKRTYAAAVQVDNTHGVKIKNNIFRHIPGSAINGTATDLLLDGNHMYDCVMESFDMGLFYINYCQGGTDVVIQNNYIHDIPNEMDEVTATSTVSQRLALYFDHNHGGGTKVINNQIVNVPVGIGMQSNNQYNNNVLVNVHKPFWGREGSEFYPMKTDTFIDDENIEVFTPQEYFATIPGFPIFADGKVGEDARKIWDEKYPSVTNWLDIMQSQKHQGKPFYEAIDNLVVNKDVVLSNNNYDFTRVDTYKGEEAMYKDIKNCTYTADTSVFVDYENGNYQLTPEGAAKYGITPLDLSKTGPKIDMVGAVKYVEANVALPKAVNNGSATPSTPSVSVPTQVQNAVVLKIGASDALVNGKVVKVDSNNSAVMPKIVNSRTLVPARFITESFGGEVGWDGETRTVTLKLNGKTVTMVLDNADLMIDGAVATVMDVPAKAIENRTMVPLRVLCETALGKKVFWDPKGLIVISDTDNILDSVNDAATIDQILGMLK